MKITKMSIENFRGYKEKTTVELNDLTVFVGKNDVGKSTVLEALDVFFNDGKGVVKLEKDDINKKALAEGNEEVVISVFFDDLPESLVLDTSHPTTLASEHLLNQDGQLEVIKRYPKAGKAKVSINAYHPTNEKCSDLLVKKITELKKVLKAESITCENQVIKAVVRQAIWSHYSADLQLQEVEVDVSKEDAKSIWDMMTNYMPLYCLFQSDRKNSDGDSEIQDPMKLAVQEILKNSDLRAKLDEVAEVVDEQLKDVANRTLAKLKEMNPDIANSLNPVIPSSESLNWASVFSKVTISGDGDIPINKRGSGVKRLVLLNFFRAEVERRKSEKEVPDVIYAIEEPETSQHPDHQTQLIKAFLALSEAQSTQIILTTHSPSIVKMLEFDNLKLIKDSGTKEIIDVTENNLPYPSLNEVNFLAFAEASEEYHNELYGYIESESNLSSFKQGKPTREYIRLKNNGDTLTEQKILSEYIRHQIHHPENTHNTKYTSSELLQSIGEMRDYIVSDQA